MRLPIYCDYAATTPMDPRVAEVLMQYLTQDGEFGNPASTTHDYGLRARAAVDKARARVAALINAEPAEIIWTSGATESNNLALFGAAQFYARRGKHIITLNTEHMAVLDTCDALMSEGFDVAVLEVGADGLVDINKVEKAMRDDTVLISVMMVNNETGVIQDVAKIGELARSRGIKFHVDAAQAAGKIPIDVRAMKIDLLSLSAHKVYGPKGMGALFVSQAPKVRLHARMYGGGQERGLRSGTLPTHQIAAMGAAFALAKDEMTAESTRLWSLRKRLLAGIDALGEVYHNGHPTQSVPGIMNVSFNFIDAEALMSALTEVAVSSSSACTTGSLETSHVLRAMGVNDVLARSSIRLSIGRFTTEEEIDCVIEHIIKQVTRLRALSPLS